MPLAFSWGDCDCGHVHKDTRYLPSGVGPVSGRRQPVKSTSDSPPNLLLGETKMPTTAEALRKAGHRHVYKNGSCIICDRAGQ